MRILKKQIQASVVVLSAMAAGISLSACASQPEQVGEAMPKTFKNTEIDYTTSFSNIIEVTKAFFADDRKHPAPAKEVPVRQISQQELDASDDVLYRLGHSTILMKIDGEYVLTDPVFSDRASPVQWMGPKRFHQPPLSIAQLPKIKAVIISHDHYDHLDKAAIQELDSKVEHFVTPLKVGDYLKDWGIAEEKITQLDWWQDIEIGTIKLTATPAQHFSGRGLFDRDHTLWASWVVTGSQHNIFFSGDGGYFKGFKEIGDKLGPFDITLIETGAYNKLWSEIHMLPEQSVQAHKDLRGKHMLPIHNGTFDLALHDWFEPLEVSFNLGVEQQVSVLTPEFGEQIQLQQPATTAAWWRPMIGNEVESEIGTSFEQTVAEN